MPKEKTQDPATGETIVSMPEGAEVIDTPLSTAAPATVEQPVANPSEEAKATYRKDIVDGKPLEINERPARLAGNVSEIAGFGHETADDRTAAQAERVKAAAKAEK